MQEVIDLDWVCATRVGASGAGAPLLERICVRAEAAPAKEWIAQRLSRQNDVYNQSDINHRSNLGAKAKFGSLGRQVSLAARSPRVGMDKAEHEIENDALVRA